MKEVILALLAGIIVGIVFKAIRLPLPAPPMLAGVMGIFGIYIGGMIATKVFEWFQRV